MFNVNHGPVKDFSIEDTALKSNAGDADPEQVLELVLNAIMQKGGVSVTLPDEAEFVAAVPESHRKSEKAYHVKAFRGSKDGRKPEREQFYNCRILTMPQAFSSSSETASSLASRSRCTSSTSTASNRFPIPPSSSVRSTWSSRTCQKRALWRRRSNSP